ncbi:hypothetical protein [Robertkochia solimangrovi]|uniref:hypothetical protein n=1 Tax=Robertkochia solimangrovi TaxID=2213046 RepID=UPI00117E0B1D|nr:hypothetical protein [Robertkochia solimangrovi]
MNTSKTFSLNPSIFKLVFLMSFLMIAPILVAQEKSSEKSEIPLSWHLTNNPEIGFKINGAIQFWSRYTQWNPDSMDDKGHLRSSAYDVSVRRFRFNGTLNVTENFKFYAQVGENNFNQSGQDIPIPKILDLYAEAKITPFMKFGFGKSTWDGLSRYTAPSTLSMLTADLPIIAQPTLNITDDVTRNFGMFIHGDIGKANYRFAFIDPYDYGISGATPKQPGENRAEFTQGELNPQFTAYLKYDLLEKENNNSPNFVGTYLGKHRYLSLGAGMKYQNNAMQYLQEGDLRETDLKLWAADIFWEQPVDVGIGQALTAYSAWYHYDMGPNYLRMVGVNNPAFGIDSGSSQINGKGNAFPMIGTGNAYHLQLGLMLGSAYYDSFFDNFQLYASGQWSNFEALGETVDSYNAGINWYLNGQRSKITIDVQNRPVFSGVGSSAVQSERKWMVVLQYQFKLN